MAEGDDLVILGDFLSEVQAVRQDKKNCSGEMDGNKVVKHFSGFSMLRFVLLKTNTDPSMTQDDLSEHLSSKALTAKLAAKELETLQVRLECQQLYNDNTRLREEFNQLKQGTNPKKFIDLQKEVEQLHWQLNKMENSRKLYEVATTQLVTFLEQVSSSITTGGNSIRGSMAGGLSLAGLRNQNQMTADDLST